MSEEGQEDFSPLGVFISVVLALLLLLQVRWIIAGYLDGNYEATMVVGLLSFVGCAIAIPGVFIGRGIIRKLNKTHLGALTMSLSIAELLVFVWSMTY